MCTVRGSAFMFYRLDVEAELHHVAVLHDVVLALHTDLTASLQTIYTKLEIITRHNYENNKSLLISQKTLTAIRALPK